MAKGSGGEQQKKRAHKHAEPEGDTQASADVKKKGAELKEDIDELLDEIDEVLEENAEEFVRSYVQKGGE